MNSGQIMGPISGLIPGLVWGVIWGLLVLLAAPGLVQAVENGGLGPLPVKNLFPIQLPFLNLTPQPVLTLPERTFELNYQFAVANTIVNTQAAPGTPSIAQAQVDQGLSAANFPGTGFGAYVDMETQHHTFTLRYGLPGGFELGLEQSWISFGGGTLDSSIEDVEGSFSALNAERAQAARNQFHYTLVHDGRLLVSTSSPADLVPADPVLSLKWNWTEGGDLLPAVSLFVAYKQPLDSAASLPRSLVSSGQADTAYAVLLSKAIGNVVAHFQIGESQLGGGNADYVSSLPYKLFALEFRNGSNHSLLLQISTQDTVLNGGHVTSGAQDFGLLRQADVLVAGYKYRGERWRFDVGFVEDYNSRDDTTDIVLFFDLGWKW